MNATHTRSSSLSVQERNTENTLVRSSEIRRRLVFISSLLEAVPPDVVGPVLIWRDRKDDEVYWQGLEGSSTTIGRSLSCDLVIDVPSVSRSHAKIWCEEGAWRIKDLGSANGTFVDGARVENEMLGGSQIIRFGNLDGLFLGPAELEAEFQ